MVVSQRIGYRMLEQTGLLNIYGLWLSTNIKRPHGYHSDRLPSPSVAGDHIVLSNGLVNRITRSATIGVAERIYNCRKSPCAFPTHPLASCDQEYLSVFLANTAMSAASLVTVSLLSKGFSMPECQVSFFGAARCSWLAAVIGFTITVSWLCYSLC